ncbi:NADP(H)-dependent aldo-keto reductase [soil metagenome]
MGMQVRRVAMTAGGGLPTVAYRSLAAFLERRTMQIRWLGFLAKRLSRQLRHTSRMDKIILGTSDLQVTPICLGTMVFGQQVGEETSHKILSHAVDRGVDFIDTAEMYSVPTRAETYGATEKIIGSWFAKNPGMRQKVVLATKIAGPSRGMSWVRGGARDVRAADFTTAVDASLKRLQTDCIDLYQLHWPNRNVPAFGGIYFDPSKDKEFSSAHEQLEAMAGLIKAGKIRHIGLSNETPYGLGEFIKAAEMHNLPKVVSVQNPYCLVNRTAENGLDESMYRYNVGLLAYSPLAFGALSGKYDQVSPDTAAGLAHGGGAQPATTEEAIALADAGKGRLALFETMRAQRWGRADALAAARRYNALARRHGLTPVQMALSFCYHKWQVASTIIGVTSLAQLDQDIDAWDTRLSPELLAEIDQIRWEIRDPAQ